MRSISLIRLLCLISLFGLPVVATPQASDSDAFWEEREAMVTTQIEARGVKDPRVLESMKEVGIGNLVFLEVNVGVPRGKVDFLSKEWQDLFAHAVSEAERLGIEITMGVGPGWTGSGGPWVKPERSMLHMVASSTEIKGPAKSNIMLPVPEPRRPFFGIEGLTETIHWYRDHASG